MSEPLDLTFVFPCLNEEATLGGCIAELKSSLDQGDYRYEIVVADNGSTDRSAEIATSLGARVVPVREKGYGAALRGGIEAAAAPYVMFADADLTYMLNHAHDLFEKAREVDADMAIASRMTGDIQTGAMPWLHRHLGTPVLTTLINVLFKGKLSDCNSGFRCIKKSAYESWGIRGTGMEFASELLIKALKHNAKTVEIPSGLRPDQPGREPHLRTWRDGMRHLLFILSERPSLFEISGLALLVITTLLQGFSLFAGPSELGKLNVFDVHTQTFLLLFGLVGTQLYVLSATLYVFEREKPLGITRAMIGLGEGALFFVLLLTFLADAALIAGIVIYWATRDFHGLNLMRTLLPAVHLLGCSGALALGLLGVHIFKRSR
jgi:glycosyltransferase involved in cell wall biosynthesis